MTDDVFIKVEQLTRHFGVKSASDKSFHYVVDHLNFEVRKGEVLGFLGPNGAGKSTTMSMLTGNLAPSHGRITINGIDLLDQPKQAKAHIGYLPEQPPLYREFTVDEYLQFCATIHNIPRPKRKQALQSAKERCGLEDVGKRLIANLSKGYQQRVGIAQAIIHSPAVVILDEPTVGLDPIQIREIRHLIRELGGDHCVILSTHILQEVQAICDRVQIINKGKLVLSDTVEGLTQHMQTSSLILQLGHPPQISALINIEAVVSVDDLQKGQFRIHHKPEHNPAPALAEMAVKHHWQLLALTPERRTLEDVFVEITRAETSPDDSKDIAA